MTRRHVCRNRCGTDQDLMTTRPDDSTARRRHESHDLPGLLLEFVTGRLVCNPIEYRLSQTLVTGTASQQRAQFILVILAQAKVERSVNG